MIASRAWQAEEYSFHLLLAAGLHAHSGLLEEGGGHRILE